MGLEIARLLEVTSSPGALRTIERGGMQAVTEVARLKQARGVPVPVVEEWRLAVVVVR